MEVVVVPLGADHVEKALHLAAVLLLGLHGGPLLLIVVHQQHQPNAEPEHHAAQQAERRAAGDRLRAQQPAGRRQQQPYGRRDQIHLPPARACVLRLFVGFKRFPPVALREAISQTDGQRDENYRDRRADDNGRQRDHVDRPARQPEHAKGALGQQEQVEGVSPPAAQPQLRQHGPKPEQRRHCHEAQLRQLCGLQQITDAAAEQSPQSGVERSLPAEQLKTGAGDHPGQYGRSKRVYALDHPLTFHLPQ